MIRIGAEAPSVPPKMRLKARARGVEATRPRHLSNGSR